MRNITDDLDQIYRPAKAIVVNVCKAAHDKCYVEAFDFTEEGKPVNAHPLSLNEMRQLAEILSASEDLQHEHLEQPSFFPENLLHCDSSKSGNVIWYTPPRKVHLLFKPVLGIGSGTAYVPSLIWKADADNLYVFAQLGKARPKPNTVLHRAPLFNIHDDGKVCMGTVDVEMEKAATITDFIKRWEDYFWNSYFSHLLDDRSPVKENIVSLWKRLVNTKDKFPEAVLKPTKYTLNDLLK